jgi:hypothetical protein
MLQPTIGTEDRPVNASDYDAERGEQEPGYVLAVHLGEGFGV